MKEIYCKLIEIKKKKGLVISHDEKTGKAKGNQILILTFENGVHIEIFEELNKDKDNIKIKGVWIKFDK